MASTPVTMLAPFGSRECTGTELQDRVCKAGGIGPLLAVIDTPLAKQPLVAQATHALAMLAKHNLANQDAIATAGGIRPLVEQLNVTRPDGENQNTPLSQANAALALTWICHRHEENQSAVADLGGVAQLGVLLKRGSAENVVEAEAAGALWSLAEDHEANKGAIASAGAIATLCELRACHSSSAPPWMQPPWIETVWRLASLEATRVA